MNPMEIHKTDQRVSEAFTIKFLNGNTVSQ